MIDRMFFILIFGLLCTSFHEGVAGSPHWYVLGPNVLRLEIDETFLIGFFGEERNQNIKVWLSLENTEGMKIDYQDVTVASKDKPVERTMRLSANHIKASISDANKWKPKHAQVTAIFNDGTNYTEELTIVYNTGFLIVQTDKPLYTPNEGVSVRVLSLDEGLRISTKKPVIIDIMDPSHTTAIDRANITEHTFGFYKYKFTLPEYAENGEWTIKASYDSTLDASISDTQLFETTAVVQFEVREYVVPTFDVNISPSLPYILPDTKEINISVSAMYVYGKPVEGFAILTVNTEANNETTIKDRELVKGFASFPLDISKLASPFPEGSRLRLKAQVTEDVTGKSEADTTDALMFVECPLKIEFSKSRLTYIVGRNYYLLIDVFWIDGTKAKNQEITIEYNNTKVSGTTDDSGSLACIIPMNGTEEYYHYYYYYYYYYYYGSLEIMAYATKYTRKDFHLTIYPIGYRQHIFLEKILKEGKDVLRLNKDIKNNKAGAIIAMVERGRLIKHWFSDRANFEETISTETVVDGARIFAFAIDSDSKMYADSIAIEVGNMCKQGKKITLSPAKSEIYPGDSTDLSITGPAATTIALNVMDKALLLLSDKNVLKQEMIKHAMMSHDLGCRVGGGLTAEDVLTNSGVTIITNGYRGWYTGRCQDRKRRRKRSIYFSKDEARILDDSGSIYEKDINALKSHLNNVPYKRSDFRTSFLFEEFTLNDINPPKTIEFPYSITEWAIQALSVLPDGGVCILDNIFVKTYKDFFIQLDLPYKVSRKEQFMVKAKVFNYSKKDLNARIYLKDDRNLCFGKSPGVPSDPQSVTVKSQSAKSVVFAAVAFRAEETEIEVSAFVRTEHEVKYDSIVKKLNVVNEGILHMKQIHVCLDPNDDMKDCSNSEEVIVGDSDLGNGLPKRTYKVNLTMDSDSIHGTGSATLYFQSNIMDSVVSTVIHGVGKTFILPSGSGEQNMAKLALIVYGKQYLQATFQETKELRNKGIDYIKTGVMNQMRHQKSDYSYSIYNFRATQIKLTAFVAKVFCRIHNVFGNDVFLNNLDATLEFLATNSYEGGYKEPQNPIDLELTALVLVALQECRLVGKTTTHMVKAIEDAANYLEKNVLPDSATDPYLLAITTYALALSEKATSKEFKKQLFLAAITKNGEMYWNSGSNSRAVAATAYALLSALYLDDSKTSVGIVKWLNKQKISTGYSYYSTQDTVIALQALTEYSMKAKRPDVNLEVTVTRRSGYRAKIGTIRMDKGNDHQFKSLDLDNGNITNGENIFYIKVTGNGSARCNIELRWNSERTEDESNPFDISTIVIDEVKETPGVNFNQGQCDVCGECPGHVVPSEARDSSLRVNDIIATRKKRSRRNVNDSTTVRCIKISVKTKSGESKSGMSIVKVGLLTGVKASKDDMEKLMTDRIIDRYEMPQDRQGYVTMYLDQISEDETKLQFRIEDDPSYSEYTRPPGIIEVYEYYKPERRGYKLYNVGSNSVKVGWTCQNSGHCQCLKRTCPKPVEMEIISKTTEYILKKKRGKGVKPIFQILKDDIACNKLKATYAYKIKVTETVEMDQKKIASAQILKVLNEGEIYAFTDDIVDFVVEGYCDRLKLAKDKEYIVIGQEPGNDKDGSMI
ncbi:ophiophagus venom factor-like isoform X2 [Mya arenaria]|uniref:ophiophagus venom factor-like isoform X2 n=1 Tax=Mya arenaria TaxID=6604 RepID=UPI0022E03538|nr:ophiophagus venom factor-like isoform X2 [Mya arenaria]